jgi:hypothetical protein
MADTAKVICSSIKRLNKIAQNMRDFLAEAETYLNTGNIVSIGLFEQFSNPVIYMSTINNIVFKITYHNFNKVRRKDEYIAQIFIWCSCVLEHYPNIKTFHFNYKNQELANEVLFLPSSIETLTINSDKLLSPRFLARLSNLRVLYIDYKYFSVYESRIIKLSLPNLKELHLTSLELHDESQLREFINNIAKTGFLLFFDHYDYHDNTAEEMVRLLNTIYTNGVEFDEDNSYLFK